MAINLSSPGINIIEQDNTRTIRKTNTKNAIVVLPANKGELNKLTFVNSESELVNLFGKPNDYNYQEWYSVLHLLSYNVKVGIIRPSNNTITLTNANATTVGSSSNLTISDLESYQISTKNFKFAARTATELYNGLKIATIDHGADQILTLSNSVVNSTLLLVNDATGFATNDYIKINNEYLKIVAITSNNLTVQRGLLDSSTQQHLLGDKVVKWVLEENNNLANKVAVAPSNGVINETDTFIVLNTNIPASYEIGKYLKIKRTPTGSTSETFEYVKLIGKNTSNNTIEIERGFLDTTAIEFDPNLAVGETAVTLEVVLVDFYASVPVSTLTSNFPYNTLPSYNGTNGDLVYGVNSNKYGWIYDQYNDKLVIVLNDTTKKFTVGETIYYNDGITPIGEISNIENYYDTQSLLPNINWLNIASQPGTSMYGKNKGSKFDEFHLAIIDTDGKISGTPNTILETHTFLNKAVNGLNDDGIPNYWINVLESKSSYIFGGTQNIVFNNNLTLEIPSGSLYTNGNVNDENSNKLFNVYKNGTNKSSTVETLLSGGTSYDWNSPLLVSSAVDEGYDLVADPELFGDVDILVPGSISLQRALKLINICNKRGDCQTVISPRFSDVINSSNGKIKSEKIVDFFDSIPSTSYATLETSYIQIFDKYNNKYRWVPGGADVAGLMLSTPQTWLAPSGINRGVFKNGLKLAYSPNKAERDYLYPKRINSVINYSGVGIVLYGNKTALSSNSALNRIEVRSLLIALEKIVFNYSELQMFEPNDADAWETFVKDLTPTFDEYKLNRGVIDYKIICDETTNPETSVNNNIFNAVFSIIPTKSTNFINLYFTLENGNLAVTEQG